MTVDDAIVVDGVGEGHAPPDVLVLNIGIELVRSDPEQALGDLDERSRHLLAATAQAGVADDDRRTTSVHLHPQEVYREGLPPQVTGYMAGQSFEVRVRDIAEAGRALRTILDAAAPDARLHGVQFILDDDAAAMSAARDAAFDDAMTKAHQYARRAGRELGPVRSIIESAMRGGPVPFATQRGAVMETAMAVAPGQATVTVRVQLTVALQ